jgi:membrane-associated phospholipid phosphatase
VVVLAGALALFVATSLLVQARATGPFDRALLHQLVAPKGSWAAHAALAVTTLGDAVPVLTLLVLAGVVVPVRWGGGWRMLVLPWASAVIAFLAATAAKQLMGRARPPASHWSGTAQGFAFPSGHATTATAGYLVLAMLLAGLLPLARHRGLVIVAGSAVALLVGASRVVLGVHWPTDVIAGWALGTAVAMAVLVASRRSSPAP